MDKENMKREQGHEVSIALMQKDIGYIRESMTKIETTLAVFDRNFARKEELKQIEKQIDDIHRDIKIALNGKADKKEFDPIKKTLYRMNWTLISSVITGLLVLLYNAGSK